MVLWERTAKKALSNVTAVQAVADQLDLLVGRVLETAEEQALLEAAARSQSRLIYPFLFTLDAASNFAEDRLRARYVQAKGAMPIARFKVYVLY
jgi:hypothetical protein